MFSLWKQHKLLDLATNTCLDDDCAAFSNCDKIVCVKATVGETTSTTTVCAACDDDYALSSDAKSCVSNTANCA